MRTEGTKTQVNSRVQVMTNTVVVFPVARKGGPERAGPSDLTPGSAGLLCTASVPLGWDAAASDMLPSV